MSGGRIEQSPKADNPLQPLNKPLQERLFNTLEAYEKLCRKEDIRIIATARNEKEREFPDELSEWEKLEFDKYSFWKRFEIYDLPEPNEEAIIGVLRETIHQANIQANPDDYSRIAQRNDRTFRNIVENLRSTKNYDLFLTIDNFRDTLKGTWEERYQKTIKKYPIAIYIYEAVELLQTMGIDLYPFTVEPTARMMVDGNLLRQVWYWWQIRKTLSYLIDVEGILKPRDGQIEAKDRQVEVEEYISKLLNLLLKLAKRYPTEMLDSLFKFGYIVDSLNRYEEASAVLEAALNINPDYYEAWYNKGVSLDNLGKYEDAIVAWEAALNINPDDHEAWYNKGNTLFNLEKYEDAIVAYEAGLNINSDYHKAWYNKGNTLFNLEKYEDAIVAYEVALNINPSDYEAWYNKGVSLDNLEKYEDAIVAYEAALNIKSDYHKAWSNKGIMLTNLGRNEEAITAYDTALNIKPDYHEGWYNKGNTLANLGRNEEAIAAYDTALNIKPDLHQAWYNKASLYVSLENIDQAVYSLQQAINLNPEEYKESAKNNPYFDNIRKDTRFQALLQE
jgi:tetratricopeptide (TPR) repeat protein